MDNKVTIPPMYHRLVNSPLPELLCLKVPDMRQRVAAGDHVYLVDSVGKMNGSGFIQLRLVVLLRHGLFVFRHNGDIQRVLPLKVISELGVSTTPISTEDVHPSVSAMVAPDLALISQCSEGNADADVPLQRPAPSVHWIHVVVHSEYDLLFQTSRPEQWVVALSTLWYDHFLRPLPLRPAVAAVAMPLLARLDRPPSYVAVTISSIERDDGKVEWKGRESPEAGVALSVSRSDVPSESDAPREGQLLLWLGTLAVCAGDPSRAARLLRTTMQAGSLRG